MSHLFVSVVPLLIAQIQCDVRALPYIGYFPAVCVQYVSKPAQHIKAKELLHKFHQNMTAEFLNLCLIEIKKTSWLRLESKNSEEICGLPDLVWTQSEELQ